uniref:FecR/PupR family sigma factor regulator n=1 Tax=Pseudomonas aeruginosa TaxID=287 RepID=UPI002FDF618E
MNSAGEGRIPSPILDEAAEWLVRLQDSGCTDDTRQACAQWRQRSPQHAHAWERAERLHYCADDEVAGQFVHPDRRAAEQVAGEHA